MKVHSMSPNDKGLPMMRLIISDTQVSRASKKRYQQERWRRDVRGKERALTCLLPQDRRGKTHSLVPRDSFLLCLRVCVSLK